MPSSCMQWYASQFIQIFFFRFCSVWILILGFHVVSFLYGCYRIRYWNYGEEVKGRIWFWLALEDSEFVCFWGLGLASFTVKLWGSSYSQFCYQFLLFCKFDEMSCRSWVWCCLFHFLFVHIKCLIYLRLCKFGKLQHLRSKLWEQHLRPKPAVLAVPKALANLFISTWFGLLYND